MRQKPLNRWLLPGVALIWIWVIIQWLGNGRQLPDTQRGEAYDLQVVQAGVKGPRKLSEQGWDPFYGNGNRHQLSRKSRPAPGLSHSLFPASDRAPEPPAWEYMGFVDAAGIGELLGIVRAGGQERFVRAGDSILGVRLTDLSSEWMTVDVAGTTFRIPHSMRKGSRP
ncbi:hypothetical protein [Pontibacter sp. G13]|uniref:hypothetical protein n=1 Tax=Pontibacter sp. G13 TaxID=3074898 RepID=UPI0028894251|nr:hypothetical protein [Pontibacter sp. G13]WNJ21626.1 hypothetical protein RJD25_28920 [Pontibacter sp. G13]